MEKQDLGGDAEYWGYDFRHPLRTALLVLAPRPQEFAVTTAHQREAALHQADCSIAQIMRLPGAIGNAPFAEQSFGDNAVTAAGAMSRNRATACRYMDGLPRRRVRPSQSGAPPPNARWLSSR